MLRFLVATIFLGVLFAPLDSKTVLITGGAGLIGSQVNKRFVEEGYNTVVLDNLSTGDVRAVIKGKFVHGDLSDIKLVDSIFAKHSIDLVIHLAGSLYVGESVRDPIKYYKNNLVNSIQLFDVMLKYGVKKLIFSSSSTVFGHPQNIIVDEKSKKIPENPYGRSKLMVEDVLSDLDKAYGFRSIVLRYFNAAGGDPERRIKNYNSNCNQLIPILLRCAKNPEQVFHIFGTDYPTPDGTCIRDYIHTDDLARAHLAAARRLFSRKTSSSYNLGNCRGYSVSEVIKAVEQVTSKKLRVVPAERRPGDAFAIITDYSKAANELNWQPKYNLFSIISDAWTAEGNN